MSDHELRTLVSGLTYTECPRWHEGRWYFVDFYTFAILSMAPDGSDLRTELEVPQQPSGLAWLPDGRLLFVSMKDRKVMRREDDGTVVEHADLSGIATGHVNDMVVDAQGRAYVGNFGFDLMGGGAMHTASLALVQPDGTASVAAADLYFPNGSVITPDGSTLIVDETFANRISAFDIHADSTLGPRQDWAVFGKTPRGSGSPAPSVPTAGGRVSPDGCGLDADGNLWVADALGNRALLVAPGGEVRDEIRPGTGVFACMLGGTDGRDLFLSCAPDFEEHKRAPVREATVQVTRVAVGHGGMP